MLALRNKVMKIVISDGIDYALHVNYRTIDIASTDYTNIAAIVVTMKDLRTHVLMILRIWGLRFLFLSPLNMVMWCQMRGCRMCMGC